MLEREPSQVAGVIQEDADASWTYIKY